MSDRCEIKKSLVSVDLSLKRILKDLSDFLTMYSTCSVQRRSC